MLTYKKDNCILRMYTTYKQQNNNGKTMTNRTIKTLGSTVTIHTNKNKYEQKGRSGMDFKIGDVLVTYWAGNTSVETVTEIFTCKTWDGREGLEYYITDKLDCDGMASAKECRGRVCDHLVKDGKWYDFKTGKEIKQFNGKIPKAHKHFQKSAEQIKRVS